MKESIYKNKNYCLSFGQDTVFLDLEVKIKEVSQLNKIYEGEIVKMQLCSGEEDFPLYLVSLLDSNKLELLLNKLKEALLLELTPSYFSLFYVGDLVKDEKENDQHSSSFTD